MIIKKIASVKLTIAILFGVTQMSYAKPIDENCEKKWITSSAKFINQENSDYSGLLNQWEGLQSECGGSINYEARKALIYSFLGQPSKAKKILDKIENEAKGNHIYDLIKIEIESKEQLQKGQMTQSNLLKIEESYIKYVGAYPSRSEGYALLGGTQLLIGKYIPALKNLEKAKELVTEDQFQSGLYRNLCIAYFENQKFKMAYDAASKAIEIQKKVTDDKFFMYALAKTEASLGMFEDAQNALRVIALKVPNIKSDPEFMEAVDYVFKEMEKNN